MRLIQLTMSKKMMQIPSGHASPKTSPIQVKGASIKPQFRGANRFEPDMSHGSGQASVRRKRHQNFEAC